MRTKIALSLLAIGALTGCSSSEVTSTATDELASLRILTEECLTPDLENCGEVLSITNEGKWTFGEKSGSLEQVYLIRVREGVRDTKLLEANKYQADCPLAYEGTETVYSWTGEDGTHLVRSCEKVVSPDDALVKVLENLLVDLNAPS